MQILPKNGYLVVEAVEQEAVRDSGIVLPKGVEADGDMQTSHGIVRFAGETSAYKVGDIVLFSKLVPDDMLVEEKTYWFVHESDVKATLVK